MAKKCTDGSTHCPYATHFFVKATILTFYIPISQTSKGNKNRFEKSGVREIGGKIKEFSKGKDFWFEKLGGLRNQLSRVQESGILL